MPMTIELNGQTVTLTDSEARAMLNRLVQLTRRRVWLAPKFRFERHYQNWQYHNRGHSVNLFLWVVEAVGNANLPNGTTANRLHREKEQLERLLRPRTIGRFYDRFAPWQRDAARFARLMNTYMDRVREGTTSTVRVLEITRDGSFMTLQVCAALLTGGTSAAATSTGAALMRTAATGFIINEMQNSATRLGRAMAGENVTVDETVDQVVNNAIDSVTDAALGEVVGRYLGPLTDEISAAAQREITRGNLLRGVVLQGWSDQYSNAVQTAINQFVGRNPADVRRFLRECRGASNQRAAARITREHLMRNRNFRRALERNLQNVRPRR